MFRLVVPDTASGVAIANDVGALSVVVQVIVEAETVSETTIAGVVNDAVASTVVGDAITAEIIVGVSSDVVALTTLGKPITL